MNRRRLILYLIFVAYQIGAFTFTFLVDGHLDLLGLLKYIPLFKYVAFLGILFIIIDVALYFKDWRSNKQEKKDLRDENTDLKARLFDMQEAARKGENSKKA